MAADIAPLCVDDWLDNSEADSLTCSLECAICLNLLHQPVNLATCSHTFCLRCLQANVKDNSSPKCPQCNTLFTNTIVSVLSTADCINGFCNFQLSKLKVSCPHCREWTGMLGVDRANITAHYSECSQLPVSCSLGCGELIPRRDLAAHRADQCSQRLVECKLCDMQLVFELLASRLIGDKECTNCHLCAQSCGQSVLDSSADDHVANRCPHRLVECPICNERVEQRHLEHHMQANLVAHLSALAAIKADNAALRQQVADVQQSVTSLEERLTAAARAADEARGAQLVIYSLSTFSGLGSIISGSQIVRWMRQYPMVSGVQAAACDYVAKGSDIAKFVDRGGIVLIMKAMEQYKVEWMVSLAACAAISQLANDIEHARQIMDGGGVEIVVQLTKNGSRNWAVIRNACLALSSLAQHSEDFCMRVVRSGGVEAVLSVMSKYDGEQGVQCAAVDFLAS